MRWHGRIASFWRRRPGHGLSVSIRGHVCRDWRDTDAWLVQLLSLRSQGLFLGRGAGLFAGRIRLIVKQWLQELLHCELTRQVATAFERDPVWSNTEGINQTKETYQVP